VARKQPSSRRNELDWLRVGIVVGAMVYHVVYASPTYFPGVRAPLLIQLLYNFVVLWGVPLLFLIAGASAWLSLAHRTGRQFVKERTLHLLVPFLSCVFTVIPITDYLATLLGSGTHIPFWPFYVDYFQGYAQFFQGNPLVHVLGLWQNFWFIFVIFLLSLIMLPLILLLKGPRGAGVTAWYAMVCRLPGGTLSAVLVFVFVAWILGVVMPTSMVSSLWITVVCPLSFVAGALLYVDQSIEQAIVRDAPVALVLATTGFVIEQILTIRQVLPVPHAGNFVFTAILIGSTPWFGAIAFLGLAKRFLGGTNRALEYLKEAVFPWFLLHMLTLTAFAYIFLEHTSLPAVLQATAIVSCSVVTLALLYEFVLKRNAFLRFILGMKSRGA